MKWVVRGLDARGKLVDLGVSAGTAIEAEDAGRFRGLRVQGVYRSGSAPPVPPPIPATPPAEPIPYATRPAPAQPEPLDPLKMIVENAPVVRTAGLVWLFLGWVGIGVAGVLLVFGVLGAVSRQPPLGDFLVALAMVAGMVIVGLWHVAIGCCLRLVAAMGMVLHDLRSKLP